MGSAWNERFFQSSRGQIVALLRRGASTIDDLSTALGLSKNGIRGLLAMLERDRLVQQRGVRRGSGKPAYMYELTPEAEGLFPKAYEDVLGLVIEEARRRHGAKDVVALLTGVGRALAEQAGKKPNGQALDERVAGIAGVLEDLGGVIEVQPQDGGLMLIGRGCPLGAVVADHPEACQITLALVQGLLEDAKVEGCCVQGPEPHCCFRIVP